ncbi:MAG: UvrD-helicase domain-containing protein, partial [Mucispirillum sp.]|nr:UvrD-helicase domain-containing protein [Mucispirillum sp.]
MASSLNKYDNLALEASAGTGKTFQLAMRVAGMLLTGAAPRDILCLTFTKKATAEMKERIIKFINGFAEGTADKSEYEFITPLMQKYAEKLNEPFNDNFIKEKAVTARDNLFSHFSELNIKTIDAFNNTILRIFPFEAGFRPDFDVQSDEETAQIKRTAFYQLISEVLIDNKWKQILDNIYPVLGVQTVALISTLQKYAEYVADNILKLENAVKNAPDLDSIIDMISKAVTLQKEIPELCQKFKKTFEQDNLGVRQANAVEKLDYKDIQDISDIPFFKKTLDEAPNFKKYEFTQKQYTLRDKIFDKLQEYWLLYGDIITSLSLNLGKSLNDKMDILKKEQNMLTYSDISNAVYYMLATDNSKIDKDYLYFRLDGKINHLLIDEFQDTSISQWLTLKPLAEEAMAGLGQHDKVGSFFYVGDPKQNIYRFRGGSSSLFRLLLKEYKNKLSSKTLDTNYRSGKNIVDIVNQLSNDIYKQYGENFAIFNIDQKAYKENGDGYVEITHKLDKQDKEEDAYYLTYCLDKIKMCIDKGFQYKDIAILTVSNSHGKDIIDYLEDNEIPVQAETSANLTSSPVFNIIMALAEFIETDDDYAFFKFLYTSPKAAQNNIMQDKDLLRSEKNKIKDMLKNIEGLSIFDKLLYLSSKLDLQSRFNSSPDYYVCFDVISKTAANETNISDFKEAVYKAASSEQALSASQKNAVTVMTIHKSKGLQFNVVLLPNLARDITINAKNSSLFVADNNVFGDSTLCCVYSKKQYPYIAGTKAEEYMKNENMLTLQDSVNMLYVAMTRAEKALFINAEIPKDMPLKISHIAGVCFPENVVKGTLKAEKKAEKEQAKSVTIDCNINKERKLIETKAFYSKKENVTHDYLSALAGSCLHAGLFMLEYGREESILSAEKCMYAKYGSALDEKTFADIKKQLLTVYNNKQWQQLFNGRVFKERRIGENNNLYSVDIYSEMEDKIVIMDYKTGTLN